MCALEVDQRVAQRYLLKRRLGKGVSPGVGGVGGAGRSRPGPVPDPAGLRASRPASSYRTCDLGKLPSPRCLRFPVTGPTPRELVTCW